MSVNGITTTPRSQRAEQAGTVLLYGIVGLLLFGPLAFGATEPWSIFLMEAGSAALFLLWIGKQILQDGMKITWNPLFLPMGVFGVLILSQLIFGSAYWHDTESQAPVLCLRPAVLPCRADSAAGFSGAPPRAYLFGVWCRASGLCFDLWHLRE